MCGFFRLCRKNVHLVNNEVMFGAETFEIVNMMGFCSKPCPIYTALVVQKACRAALNGQMRVSSVRGNLFPAGTFGPTWMYLEHTAIQQPSASVTASGLKDHKTVYGHLGLSPLWLWWAEKWHSWGSRQLTLSFTRRRKITCSKTV